MRPSYAKVLCGKRWGALHCGPSRCSRGAASLYSARTSCPHHLWGPSAQRMSRGGILHALV